MKHLIRNPELFMGEKYINRNYFEGWYFKVAGTLAVIAGIHQTKNKRGAFIQVIFQKQAFYEMFDFNDFSYGDEPFYIQIGENYFSKEKMILNIPNLINCQLYFSNSVNIQISPNIMGPFSYIPFMQCNHAILSMKNEVNGKLIFQQKEYIIQSQSGYIEKDWGTSFPSSYQWYQANTFNNQSASFMCAIATIPFGKFSFTGVICVLKFDGKEYLFTTYNHTKIIQTRNDIILKKGNNCLYIHPTFDKAQSLLAPVHGDMTHTVKESITSTIQVILKKGNNILFEDTSHQAGIEIDGIFEKE